MHCLSEELIPTNQIAIVTQIKEMKTRITNFTYILSARRPGVSYNKNGIAHEAIVTLRQG